MENRDFSKQVWDVLLTLVKEPFVNQRMLAESTGYSLGTVNKSLRILENDGFLNSEKQLTGKAVELLNRRKPRNAVILAAGYGMRMAPIHMETHKALLEVKGEPLIERMITQLHQVGIREIYVVVGYLKEKLEYLVDAYGVKLVVNDAYAVKNNLHTLRLVADRLSNTYIIPCDIWCAENPFRERELYSWYMVSEEQTQESDVRVSRKNELVIVGDTQSGNKMIGIAFLLEEQSAIVTQKLLSMDGQNSRRNAFWEETLLEGDHMLVCARMVSSSAAVEINTYEQLRELDSNSIHLQSEAITLITQVMQVSSREITEIAILKKGMTNRSFLFNCGKETYIMRIPGEGTEKLIDRKKETAVYQALADKGISDDVIYMNPENGYKITKFLQNSRVCDPENQEDLKACMQKLREFHQCRLKVAHTFDIFEHILFYEKLWDGQPSVFRDYRKTKEQVFALKKYVEAQPMDWVLTHIDAVPDNFLFVKGSDGGEEIRLIDWEYAGMQDPHVDIAMFCIYAMYSKEQVDQLIDLYFEGYCPDAVRYKIYCYISACGLLWSNWCEYKRQMGVEFGEYSLSQYQYAKEYCRIVKGKVGDFLCTE